MEENRNRRWLIIGFFLLIGLLFVGSIYTAVVGPRSMQSQRRLESAVSSYENKMRARSDEKTVILSLGLVISASLIAASLILNSAKQLLVFEFEMFGLHSLSVTEVLGVSGYIIATFLGLWLVFSIIRSGKL